MTIALSYLDDLSRVRIDLSDLPDGVAHVERSTNDLFWETVRGGVELPVVDGVAQLDDYEFPIVDRGEPLNPNPGFESGTDEWNTSGCALTRSTDEARSGRASGLITPDGSATAAILSVIATSAPVTPGTSYTYSAWVYSPDGWDEVVLQVQWVTGTGSGAGSASGPVTVIPAGVWTLLSLTAEAPANAARAQQVLGMTGSPTAADLMYVDDAILAEALDVVTYRVTVAPPGDEPEYVGVGAVASSPSSTVTLNPAPPAGLAEGDLLTVLASAKVGDVETPTGYTLLSDSDRGKLFGKIAGSSEPAPGINCTDGEPDGSFIAQCAAWRNVSFDISDATLSTSAANTTIPTPALSIDQGRSVVIQYGWRSVQWSNSITMPVGATRIASTPGDSSGQVWAYRIQDDAENVDASEFNNFNVAFGGVDSASGTVAVNPIGLTTETRAITPTAADCELWLKGIRYPLLNQQVSIADYSPLDRAGRGAVSPIQGRSFPVASTDIAGAFEFEATFVTDTAEQARKLDLSLAVGDIFYLQIPPDGNPRLPPKSMYVVVRGLSVARLGVGEKRHVSVQLVEVAMPSPLIVGTTLTWGTVLNRYASWSQLINANPTWRDLLATVGSPYDLVTL